MCFKKTVFTLLRAVSGRRYFNYQEKQVMHDVRADQLKNRIIITIGKLDGEAEMQAVARAVSEECKKLKKGFTCITDLRKYEVQDDAFEHYVRQTQEAMIAAGLAKVVRVVRETGLLGHFQFDNASMDVGYHADNVTSMEAAEKILNEAAG
ncbi:MAG: hypothetical protein COX19_13130 [Desulfobacterales bacterium CG23_combo_of_CG06-09_8_20_14_all_51_8]|nr:MAG: hypothetical protein COX19_13130 [Desulfobacterales bacterium CG23_combo_of_CG06-09_8_20_14_all_51_8]